MKLSSLALALAMPLLPLLPLLNWSAFSAPTLLNLGVAEVQAPLGIVLLIFTGLLSALFLFYIVVQQAGMILEARRTAKELKGHREVADQAEASRVPLWHAVPLSSLSDARSWGGRSPTMLLCERGAGGYGAVIIQ